MGTLIVLTHTFTFSAGVIGIGSELTGTCSMSDPEVRNGAVGVFSVLSGVIIREQAGKMTHRDGFPHELTLLAKIAKAVSEILRVISSTFSVICEVVIAPQKTASIGDFEASFIAVVVPVIPYGFIRGTKDGVVKVTVAA